MINGFYCGNTEVLTTDGFKKLKNVTGEDLVGTIINNELAFMKPLKIVSRNGFNSIVNIHSNVLDISFTKDLPHYLSSEDNVDDFKFLKLEDLVPGKKYYLPKNISYEESAKPDMSALERITAAKLVSIIFMFCRDIDNYDLVLEKSDGIDYLEELKAICEYQRVSLIERDNFILLNANESLVGISPIVEFQDYLEGRKIELIVPSWLGMLDAQAKRAFASSVLHYSNNGDSLRNAFGNRKPISKKTIENFQIIAFQGALPIKIEDDGFLMNVEESSYILDPGNRIDIKEIEIDPTEVLFNIFSRPSNVLLMRRNGHIFLGAGGDEDGK